MVVPNVQLAVLENCVPGEFGGTALLSTHSDAHHDLLPGWDRGER